MVNKYLRFSPILYNSGRYKLVDKPLNNSHSGSDNTSMSESSSSSEDGVYFKELLKSYPGLNFAFG